jgi:hypothetical protein
MPTSRPMNLVEYCAESKKHDELVLRVRDHLSLLGLSRDNLVNEGKGAADRLREGCASPDDLRFASVAVVYLVSAIVLAEYREANPIPIE